ncbi:hypothetical protein KFL_000240420 [Klebsormidium nitens]|uniref:MBD domain-containing protein n=1 Tax=Klebsormidium nitens TaxID=105231 RepID=A0A1Y1HKJ8_KLENI|nr:hypothetical protein KFL_000240420 [Klebsormidium nitens]|eukprot:GAQ79110.1 hypothetical protein KFL_000240420 [Klebsormidium nitens]
MAANSIQEGLDDGKSFWCEAPPGWKKRVTYRSSTTVNSRSKADVYFYAPSDSVHTTRFRSEKKLREYLTKNTGIIPNLPPPEAFDWSYPGGTREGKCKNGPPLTTKAAPDTPRHTPVKTTGKRDPRKRPRESPHKDSTATDNAEKMHTELANGASRGSNAPHLRNDDSEEPASKPEGSDEESGAKAPEPGGNEAGPAPKKKKGRPSAAEKLATEGSGPPPETQRAQKPERDPQDEASAGKSETRDGEEVKEGLVENVLSAQPAAPKRKGRPPRTKGEGKGGAAEGRGKGAAIGKAEDALRGKSEAQVSVGEGLNGGKVEAARGVSVEEPAQQSAVAERTESKPAEARPDARYNPSCNEMPGETGVGQQEAAQEGREDDVLAEGQSNGVPENAERGEEFAEVPKRHENERAAPQEGPHRAAPEAGAAAGIGPLTSGEPTDGETLPGCKGERDVSDAPTDGNDVVREGRAELAGAGSNPSLRAHAPEKVGVKLEDMEAPQPQGGVLGAGKSAPSEKEGADGTGTPLSILDAEKDRALRSAGGSGADLLAQEEALREGRVETNREAQAAEPSQSQSQDLQCSETVPSPELAGSGNGNRNGSEQQVDGAPGPSQPEPEPVETKAMRKKARLAKVLGPHELVARPRREKPPPPPPLSFAPPRGIADAVKLRTAGAQEKKNARQQVGERVYPSRLPHGFSVSAVIAAAAAAPPSPLPKIRGRPPKQKNGPGSSRLGTGKQSEEEAEERKVLEQREEHEAAVRIFKEEEEERERVLKERGFFHPRDESLADRPRPPPVHGKRRTKSALLAEYRERLKQERNTNGSSDEEDENDDDSLLGDDDDLRHSKGEAREALLHRKRVDMRARRKAERDNQGEDGEEEVWARRENGDREKKGDGRKKRKAGWTMVRTQKRTAVVNGGRFREDRGEGAGPSRRAPGRHIPRGHRTHFPRDPEPDPTYDSDANSSELKMGQKLDEHGFFERDEFEVASQEGGGDRGGRRPPRERLPLEAPPQRRRSFGHRKGPSGGQAREGLRIATEQGGGPPADAPGFSGRTGEGVSPGVKRERIAEQNGGLERPGSATGGEREVEAKRPRWEGPWEVKAVSNTRHDDSVSLGVNANVSSGRGSAEPLSSRDHFAAAPTLLWPVDGVSGASAGADSAHDARWGFCPGVTSAPSALPPVAANCPGLQPSQDACCGAVSTLLENRGISSPQADQILRIATIDSNTEQACLAVMQQALAPRGVTANLSSGCASPLRLSRRTPLIFAVTPQNTCPSEKQSPADAQNVLSACAGVPTFRRDGNAVCGGSFTALTGAIAGIFGQSPGATLAALAAQNSPADCSTVVIVTLLQQNPGFYVIGAFLDRAFKGAGCAAGLGLVSN